MINPVKSDLRQEILCNSLLDFLRGLSVIIVIYALLNKINWSVVQRIPHVRFKIMKS